MHTRITRALGTAGIFLALTAPDTAIAQDRGEVLQAVTQHPLARTWILNVEKSDDAQEKMEQAQRRRSGTGAATGGRRGARGEGQGGNRGARGGGRWPSLSSHAGGPGYESSRATADHAGRARHDHRAQRLDRSHRGG